MKFLKSKAMFEIFLVLSLSFIFSLSFGNVYAGEVPSEEGFVCCSETRDGELCKYTDSDNCAEGALQHPGECAGPGGASFCQPVCCDFRGADTCMPMVARDSCVSLGGEPLSGDGTCGSYSQCDLGCCVLGSQCNYETEQQCGNRFDTYGGDLTFDFRDVGSEGECTNICSARDLGCCAEDGTGRYVTREECNGEFVAGIHCTEFDPDDDGEFVCQDNNELRCVDTDVWKFDSCGNPMEVADSGDCDYPSEVCSDRDGVVECKSLDCEEIWVNPARPDITGLKKNGESWCQYEANAGPTIDLPGTRHYRHYCENGEEKVQECGQYRDSICIEATINLGNGDKISSAGCKSNRAEDCGEQTNNYDCSDDSFRDCVWLSANQGGQADRITEEADDRLRSLAAERGEDYSGITDQNYDDKGKCIPLVPLGLQFWDSSVDGSICKSGTPNNGDPILTFWVWQVSNPEWDCEGGCDVFSNKFLKDSNIMCGAYGDCGAKYNLAEVWSKFGFKRDIKIGEFDGDGGAEELFGGDDLEDPGDINFISFADDENEEFEDIVDMNNNGKWDENNKTYEYDDSAKAFVYENAEMWPLDPGDFETKFKYYEGLLSLGEIDLGDIDVGGERLGVGLGLGITAAVSVGIVLGGYGIASLAAASASSAAFGTSLGVAAASSPWPVVGWIIAIIAVITAVVIAILTWPSEETLDVEFECSSWKAPSDSSLQRCELCNSGDLIVEVNGEQLHECTEYLCESLGRNCDFETTTDGGRCFDSCDSRQNRDSLRPVYLALSPDFETEHQNEKRCKQSIDENSADIDCVFNDGAETGREGGGQISLGYYRPNQDLDITLVTCSDPSCQEEAYGECKYSFEFQQDFDTMREFEEGSLPSVTHTISLGADIQLKKGQEFNYYVQCKNNCGNPETVDIDGPSIPDYAVNIKVADEEDTNAPILEDSNPVNGAFLPNRSLLITESDTSRLDDLQYLNLNFRKAVDECRYDNLDKPYNELENEFISCSGSTCRTPLFNMHEGENLLFIKCKNTNNYANIESIPREGYKFIGTKALEIEDVQCQYNLGRETVNNCEEIYSNDFVLEVHTKDGADEGKANCGFGSGGIVSNFYNPESESFEEDYSLVSHRHALINRAKGEQKFNIYCEDTAGNFASQEVKFNILADEDEPSINRVYQEGSALVVETDEAATCSYDNLGNSAIEEYTDFDVTGELEHRTNIEENNYFKIYCEDLFNNPMNQAEIYINQ